ncbi:MFS transporter [Bacillus horti]|uniref:MFS family permease n=1 Tax=Caldalkalibacillus horti TaxID=77523 RepID=A0ABT9VZV6_9BACI|nr:MFS transporter [Bacillus horti]MDQ0166525.1 MFS family permease [Bacillus horti]
MSRFILSNVWKLYAIRFFYYLIPAYVIERLFWEERGMTIQLVVYTEIIFAVTVVLLEVPSGILADKWGRKKMIVLAGLLGCLEFFILVFATEFWHFAVVVFLAAIGMSASSGAGNALLYDTLLIGGKEHEFEKYLGRLNTLDIAAIMIAALSGSLLAGRFGFEFNYWLSFIAMLVSFCFSLLLIEPSLSTKVEDEAPLTLKDYGMAFVRLFAQSKGVVPVLMSGMVIGAAMNFIDEFWQLYLDRVGVPVLYFGLFSAAIYVLRLPGNLLAYSLKNRFSYRGLLLFVSVMTALGFSYLSYFQDYSGLVAMGLVCLFSGLIEPLTTGYLHHRIPSNVRATLGSAQSFGENAVMLVVGLGFGYFSTKWDVFGGYGFIAFVCGLFVVYFILMAKQVDE